MISITSVDVTPLVNPPIIVSANVFNSPFAVWLAISTALLMPCSQTCLPHQFPLETALDVKRLPRVLFFVLADAERVFRRLSKG